MAIGKSVCGLEETKNRRAASCLSRRMLNLFWKEQRKSGSISKGISSIGQFVP